jgi:hypothetical protein
MNWLITDLKNTRTLIHANPAKKSSTAWRALPGTTTGFTLTDKPEVFLFFEQGGCLDLNYVGFVALYKL